MPSTNICIHLVFATKGREPLLNRTLRHQLHEHILENAEIKRLTVFCVNGYDNHVHVLLRLHPTQTLSKVVQLIKGESAYWINKKALTSIHFEWQDEYYARSVGQSEFRRVSNYIANQETHHQTNNFEDELPELFPEGETGRAK